MRRWRREAIIRRNKTGRWGRRPLQIRVGFEPEAGLNGDKASAKREKIRSIGHGSVIDDYIFEWAMKNPTSATKQSLDTISLKAVFLSVFD